jgi:hypothetical protein
VRVRRGRRRRWLRPAVAGLVAGAALGAGVAAAVLGTGHGRARTSTVVRPPPLTQAERALAAHVPAAMRRGCEHAPPPTPDFDASVTCRSGTTIRVRYDHAVSGTRMRAQLLADAVTHGVAAFGAPVAPVGVCGRMPTGIRDWAFVTSGRRAQITQAQSGAAVGRLLCYVSPNAWSALEWSDTRFDVLTQAYGGSPKALYTWWTRHGGPQPH